MEQRGRYLDVTENPTVGTLNVTIKGMTRVQADDFFRQLSQMVEDFHVENVRGNFTLSTVERWFVNNGR